MTISNYKKEPFSSMFSHATFVETVWVTTADGYYIYQFSRLDGEKQWFLDAKYRGMLPIFCHGKGSRSCLKSVAAADIHVAIENHIATLTK